MSNVWTTRYRLLLEWLEELVDLLSGEEPIAQAVVEEQAVRLLMGAARLLREHEVDKRGQCRFCGRTRWRWPFRRRRRRCMVHSAFGFAAEQNLDTVWWQLFEDAGRKSSPREVRAWLEERHQRQLRTAPALRKVIDTVRRP